MAAQNPRARTITDADDERLVPTNLRLQLKPNNFYLDPETCHCDDQIILDILKNHPLYYALNATAKIPLIYVQQLWHTLTIVTVEQDGLPVDVLQGQIDNTPITINLERFRTTLGLPSATDRPGRVSYDPDVSGPQLLADIRNLGYEKDIRMVSTFTRNELPRIWFTLFAILNRCLSSKTQGVDRTKGNFLTLFHAVAYDRHVDYAHILWRDLLANVKAKGKPSERKFVPYIRFLQLLIRTEWRINRGIHRRNGRPICPNYPMVRLLQKPNPALVPLPIPEALLSYADPEAQSVIDYRSELGLVVPTVQPDPAGPSQGAQPRSREGLSDSQVTRRASVSQSTSTPASSSTSTSSTPDATDTDDESNAETHHSSSSATNDSSSDDPQDYRIETVTVPSPPRSSVQTVPTTVGELRGADIHARQTIRERRSKRRNESIPANISRVATSATLSHPLGQSIELDIVDPAMQLHTPPVHSTASQQAVVSSSHGDFAHTLFESHLEIPNIEIEHRPPQCSTSVDAPSSIAPHTLLGTQQVGTSSAISAGLRAPAGTSVVGTQSAFLQGSDGNPISDTFTPTLNMGHTVPSTVVSTGDLRDPGVTHPVSPPMLRRPLSTDELKAQLLESLMNTSTASDAPTANLIDLLRQPDPSTPVTQAQFNEFKNEVRGNIDRLFDSHNEMRTAMQTDIQGLLNHLQGTESRLMSRLSAIEETCKSQADIHKRRRDEHDDDEDQRPEGEKRQRVSDLGGSASQPSHEQQPIDQQPTHTEHTPMVEKPAEITEIEMPDELLEDNEPISCNRQEIREAVQQWHAHMNVEKLSVVDYDEILLQTNDLPEQTEEQIPLNEFYEDSQSNAPLASTQPRLSKFSNEDIDTLFTFPDHKAMWETVTVGYQHHTQSQRIRMPFLEQSGSKIFTHELTKPDTATIHRISDKSTRHKTEHLYMLTNAVQPLELVRSEHRIVKIKGIDPSKYVSYQYPEFEVIRENGKVYKFTEADFKNLMIEDLEFLFVELNSKRKVTKNERSGLEAIVRHIQRTIELSYLEDFQMAFENGMSKVNLLKPRTELENIDEYAVMTVLEKPEFGIIHIDRTPRKCFLRLSEVAAYSDGTLMRVRLRMSARLSQEKKEPVKMTPGTKAKFFEAMKMIDDRLLYRQFLRRHYFIFDLRKND